MAVSLVIGCVVAALVVDWLVSPETRRAARARLRTSRLAATKRARRGPSEREQQISHAREMLAIARRQESISARGGHSDVISCRQVVADRLAELTRLETGGQD